MRFPFHRAVMLASVFLFASAAQALSWERVTARDANGGLKEALTQGAGKAVDLLGRTDGFLNDPRVKIPLPDSLRQAEKAMRRFGMGKQADELIVAMNRAAEAAVPAAKDLLVDAVRQMTVEDAKAILAGGDDAGTRYFRGKTAEPLARKFLPVVKQAIDKVQLARTYEKFAKPAAQFGLIDAKNVQLEHYVTEKTLDGLYLMIAEEEKAIRENPLGAAGSLAKKVFGALK